MISFNFEFAMLSCDRKVIFALNILIVICTVLTVHSAAISGYEIQHNRKNNAVVYTRYVRRRPSMYSGDRWMDEYVEVFHTKRRPPNHILTDDEIEKMIKCDFDPTLEECKNLEGPQRKPKFESTTRLPYTSSTWRPYYTTTPMITTTSYDYKPYPTTTPPPPRTSTVDAWYRWMNSRTSSTTSTTSTTTSTTTTTTPKSVYTKPEDSYTTEKSSTTTTTAIPWGNWWGKIPTTTTTTTTTTTESTGGDIFTDDFPFLPDIPTSDEDDNGNEIDANNENDENDENEDYQPVVGDIKPHKHPLDINYNQNEDEDQDEDYDDKEEADNDIDNDYYGNNL